MPRSRQQVSESGRTPALLPDGALEEILRRGRLLLCLDYDGTISEIVADPPNARPVDGIMSTLHRLSAAPDRVLVAVVSGRAITELKRLMGVDQGLRLAGKHGLELVWDGRDPEPLIDVRNCTDEVERARRWLADNIPAGEGFFLEDKQISIALHFRQADPTRADSFVRQFEDFIAAKTPLLKLGRGKMVVEVMPREASKAHAVRALTEHAGDAYTAVYFGDDITDEDAFAELAGIDGAVTILVGDPRPSRARYRVDSPQYVARILADLAQTLDHSGTK